MTVWLKICKRPPMLLCVLTRSARYFSRKTYFTCRKFNKSNFIKCSPILITVRNLATKEQKEVVARKTPKIKGGEIKRLLGLAKSEKWPLAGAVCLLVVSSSVTMAMPYFIGKLLDVIYLTDKVVLVEKLKSLSVFLLAISVVGGLANCGRSYIMSISGQRITQKLRQNVYSSIMNQEIGYFDSTSTGELVNRLSSDCNVVSSTLTQNLSDGLRGSISAITAISMMFYTSTSLSLVGLSIIPPFAGCAIIYGRYMKKLSQQTQDALAKSTQVAEESISNMRTVRTFAQEDKEKNNFIQKISKVMELAYKEAQAKGIFFGMAGFSGNATVLAVLFYGGMMASESQITAGQLTSFLMYAGYVGISLGTITSFYSELMKGVGASSRLWDLVDRKPRISMQGGEKLAQIRGEISLNDIGFTYPTRNDLVVLNNLSLRIPEGKITAVVGPSGSGKTTLASLILQLYHPTSGTITLDSVDTKTLDPVWLRKNIGTVSQEPILFSCSIRENLVYGLDRVPTEEEIERTLKEANAYNFVQSFPDKLETVVGEKGITLSGGQRQRIAIARAIIKNPKILLLDEATSSLDAESEYLVQEALGRIMKGRTVLVIAHRLSTIRNADQIAVISEGRVKEIGSFSELMKRPEGIFKQLVEKQSIK